MHTGKILTFGALAVITSGAAIFIHGTRELRNAQDHLDTSSAQVLDAYRRIAEQGALPLLSQKENLTSAQTDAVRSIQDVYDASEHVSDTRQRIRLIVGLQVTLHRMLMFADGTTLMDSPIIQQLQKDIDKQAPVRAEIDTYNTAVKEWKNLTESRIGAFSASIIGRETSPYPLLNTSGNEDYENTIQI